MPKFIDLTGQKFNQLTALEYKGKSKWLWKCDCGNTKIIISSDVKSGKTKSCGCLHKNQLIERNKQNTLHLENQRFGKLVVIKQIESRKGRSNWLCKCDCGNFKEVTSDLLMDGQTKSCGCLRSSFEEEKIEKILVDNNIEYKKEFWFDDLRSAKGIPLRFDFAIFNKNILQYLIEYDGEQHYLEKADKIFSDTLENRQIKDKQKNEYCLNNHIPLYRIPYWEKQKIINIETLLDKKYLISK